LLWEYLGWKDKMPQWAHFPLILKPDGKGKLSKRDGDRLGFPVFAMDWTDPKSGETAMGFKEMGFMPEAFTNLLALLGWNDGSSEEIFNLETLASLFSIERIHKGGAKFDFEKAKWFNKQYLLKKSDEELAHAFKPILKEKGFEKDDDFLIAFCRLVKEKVHFVHEFWEQGKYVFEAPTNYDEKVMDKKWNDQRKDIFTKVLNTFEAVSEWKTQVIHDAFESLVKEMGKIEESFARVYSIILDDGRQKAHDAYAIIEEEF
jgi:glutamyl-tRNA synthetase